MTPPAQPRRLHTRPKVTPLIDAQTFQLLMDRLHQQDQTMDRIETTVDGLAAEVLSLKHAHIARQRFFGVMQRWGYAIGGASATVGLTAIAHALGWL